MMNRYHTIIIGLGAMGSACAYHLAKAGVNVLGIEQFSVAHDKGSSHGGSRVTRLATAEGDQYMPFAKRSLELIKKLEQDSQKQLYYPGGIFIGPPNEEGFISATIQRAKNANIQHEVVRANDIHAYCPNLIAVENSEAYYEPTMGTLDPEGIISSHIELAKKLGADIHEQEQFLDYSEQNDIVTVRTNKNTYQTQKLVITAGAWIPELMGGDYQENCKIYRATQFYFKVLDKKAYLPNNFPTCIRIVSDTLACIIIPDIHNNHTIKLAPWPIKMLEDSKTTPSTVNRTVSANEINYAFQTCIKPYFKHISHECMDVNACLVTTTPNEQFIIKSHNGNDNIIVVSACSGHGFKHSPAIGESLSQHLCDQPGSLKVMHTFNGSA